MNIDNIILEEFSYYLEQLSFSSDLQFQILNTKKELVKSNGSITTPLSLSLKFRRTCIGHIIIEKELTENIKENIQEIFRQFYQVTSKEFWSARIDSMTKDLISMLYGEKTINININNKLLSILEKYTFSNFCQFYLFEKDGTISLASELNSVSQFNDLELDKIKDRVSLVMAKNKIHIDNTFEFESINRIMTIPVSFGNDVLGAYVIGNKSTNYLGEDLYIIKRFLRFSCHIIKKQILEDHIISEDRKNSDLKSYLSKNIIETLKLKSLSTSEPEKKDIVVMFGIFHQFEEVVKNYSPKIVSKLLNILYEKTHQVIEKWDGTIDKIMGDTFLVYWNHPKVQMYADENALNCSIELLNMFNSEITPFFKEKIKVDVGMGIGINKGPVVVGNLGCKDFLDYTAIGDTINTCQRVESQTSMNQILVHDNLLINKHIADNFNFKNVHTLKVKGKQKPITAYELDYDKN